MEEQALTFPNRGGQQLVGTLTHGEKTDRAPGVLVLHGFRGHRDERHIRAVANALAEVGLVVLRVDLTHNIGESEGDFRHLTISHEVLDAQDALTFLSHQPQVEPSSLGITGHSLGGLVAALAATHTTAVRAVVTLSAVFDLHERFTLLLGAEAVQRWAEQGELELDPPGSGLYLEYGFYQDLVQLKMAEELRRLQVPLRIVHGEADAEVPVGDAELYYQHAASPNKEIAIIPGADHLYRAGHHLERVCFLTADWLQRQLLPSDHE